MNQFTASVNSGRKLAAIMFTDIVGYTSLMGSDEAKAMQLLHTNRRIHQTLIKKYRGKWLKEMGDGTLASFKTTSDAVYCAGALIAACQQEDIQLRIGIHQGEIVEEKGDIFGDGVNVASRIEPLASPGEILVSGPVHRNIKNQPGIQSDFVEEHVLKNVDEPVRIYRVSVDRQEQEVKPTGKNKLGAFKVAGIIAAALLMVFLLVYLVRNFRTADHGEESSVGVTTVDKSIAVLPFRNDSPDQENEYFCNGMMEEILDKLSKIKDLKIPSRTAVEVYRNTTMDPREIGSELNVAHVLEGSVRKQGDQFRISVQLINAKDGYHVWSETYSGTFSDTIFIVQSNLAKSIARELNAAITPEEYRTIERKPTASIDAYELTLQAWEMLRMFWRTLDDSYLETTLQLFRKALKLDSNLGSAISGVGTVYFTRGGYDSALYYANKAIEVNPNEPEGYYLKGECYRFMGDAEEAKINLEKALEIDPNQMWANIAMGNVLCDFDQNFAQGLPYLIKALELSGKGRPEMYLQVGTSFLRIGEFSLAEHYIKKALELQVGCLGVIFYNGLLLAQGKYGRSLQFLDSVQSSGHCKQIIVGSYAWTFYKEGTFLKADSCLKEFTGKKTDFLFDLNVVSAYVDLNLGREAQAEQKLREVLADYSDDEEISGEALYALAQIFNYKRDRNNALKYLKALATKRQWWAIDQLTRNDSGFNNLRDDPDFQSIVRQMQDEQAAVQSQIAAIEKGEKVLAN